MNNRVTKLIAGTMLAVAVVLLAGCLGGGGAAGGASANIAPVANAGVNQSVMVGTTVTLNGSLSADANNDTLTDSWALSSKPANSTATLTGATSVTPSFTADQAGDYVVTLVVNDGKVDSAAAIVTITASIGNAAPVANAGSAQNVTTGTVVTLNGGASSDANSDPLTYSWTLTGRPASSIAALTGAATAAPTFTADRDGAYVATLVVNDGTADSAAATVTITAATANSAPVANAGVAQRVTMGTVVTLNGGASSDANSDPLTYSWTLTGRPASSIAALTGATTAAPSFTADLVGSYVATLIVNDGKVDSAAATVTITATSRLNDTGITASQCYQAVNSAFVACNSAGAIALSNAQDGMTGRDVNTADNADGKLGFSFTAVTGGCVQDNVTGLMWEVKTTDGGLRDWTKAYTNYDSTTSAQKWDGVALAHVNPTQADIDAATNTVGYVAAVNAGNLCGFNDWRLPSADELQSIVDYGVPGPDPTIDTTWFPNTQAGIFWSSSPYAGGVDAWLVAFDFGNSLYYSRSASFYVRLVRTGQ